VAPPTNQASITLFAIPQEKDGSVIGKRPKITKSTKPILTITNVAQAFAVYPERPELISSSTLAKVEGVLGEEEWGGNVRGRDGWAFFMFDGPATNGNPTPGDAREMLRILTGRSVHSCISVGYLISSLGIHDAFGLYGRPPQSTGGGYTWDPRDYHGLMFCYPVGELKQVR
jgi:CCR4-NOT transcriptional complex subunit CAF120